MPPIPARQNRKNFVCRFPMHRAAISNGDAIQIKHFQYTSFLHRLSRCRQQSEQAARQQKIKPAIWAENGISRPEAAGSPEEHILMSHSTVSRYENISYYAQLPSAFWHRQAPDRRMETTIIIPHQSRLERISPKVQ